MLIWVFSLLVGCASFFAAQSLFFNWIIGSFHAHFSCLTVILPGFIKQFGLVYAILLYCTKAATVKNLSGFILGKSALLISSYAYQRITFLSAVILPALCMIAFMIHPIGSQVFFYSFYWIIPMLVYAFYKDHILGKALIAAFLMHALGSITWLYWYQLPQEAWIAALPVVPFERCLMALGIACADTMYQHLFSALKKIQVRFIS